MVQETQLNGFLITGSGMYDCWGIALSFLHVSESCCFKNMTVFDFLSLNDFLHRKGRPAVFFFMVTVYAKGNLVIIMCNVTF